MKAMPNRSANFSAGPAALPTEVLHTLQQECLDWRGHGFSAFEFSHRHKDFVKIVDEAVADTLSLLGLGEDFAVLFLQGGATTQFSAIPMNLLANTQEKASYAITGTWSKKAAEHAKNYACVHYACNQPNASSVEIETWDLDAKSGYIHFCPNETVSGLEFYDLPKTDIPLVADMSSTLFSRPFAASRYGLIYAGAQKNIGPAGLTLVIIRKDLLAKDHQKYLPPTLNYALQAKENSLLNTPPTMAIYLTGLVLKWIIAQGGLPAMATKNAEKANLLYQTIDQSELYQNNISIPQRSHMNVTFSLANEESLLPVFLQKAEKAKLFGLKGHRLVGGLRASIYNAVPLDAVKNLVAFMKDFEEKHG